MIYKIALGQDTALNRAVSSAVKESMQQGVLIWGIHGEKGWEKKIAPCAFMEPSKAGTQMHPQCTHK